MRSISLDNFIDDLHNVREYIQHIHLVNKVEAATRKSPDSTLLEFNIHLHSFGKDKKLFEYKSIVISLYGIIEKHINIWIQEHVESLSSIIIKYDELPDSIQSNHFRLSVRLLSLLSKKKYSKYDHLNKEDVLLKLSTCIDGSINYAFNGDAFSPSSGNLKHSKIVEAFRCLDIKLKEKMRLNCTFLTFLKKKYGKDALDRDKDWFADIDDLVVRRNDIAHGVQIDNILHTTEFNHYIEFLEHYGRAIFETIAEKEIQYEAEYRYKKIDDLKGVYKHGSILCFEIENHHIEKGDHIIVQTADDYFVKKEILEIQKKNTSFDRLSITDKVGIGVNLGAGITMNQTFYIKD